MCYGLLRIYLLWATWSPTKNNAAINRKVVSNVLPISSTDIIFIGRKDTPIPMTALPMPAFL